ncbi:MAG: TIGR04086 family membrane protein [Oscillospiraceae bacterium]|nr:TIGR04086 family membrane protein [Oscillospiraceae bacterium]
MVKKITGRAPSLVKSVAAGVLLGAAWTLLCAVVLAKLIDSGVMPMEKVGYGSMAAVLSAVFAGASLAGRKAGHMVVQAAAISGAAYFLCLILVNALFFGGSYSGMAVTFVLIALATVAAVLAAGKGSGSHRRKRYKIPK